MSGGIVLTVYGREDCHLCDDMIAALEINQQKYLFNLEVINIDEDDGLELKYGHLVPVLASNDEEICHYFFDSDALAAYFGKIR